jgi:hypothetical protein
MQLSAMRAYAKRRGWSVATEVEEVGSGVKSRPQREEILKVARRRKLDAIVVWRLDRWGRSLLDLIGTLQELHAVGVGFVSLTEALDMTTPGGRALVACSRHSQNSSATPCETVSRLELLKLVRRGALTAGRHLRDCVRLKFARCSQVAQVNGRSPPS